MTAEGRVITYEARDQKLGMTPAEASAALSNAVEVKRWKVSIRGKLLALTVVEKG
jgi:hypothetical protein